MTCATHERVSISNLIPAEYLSFVKGSGSDLLDRIGESELRSLLAGIICGHNVRTATEPLTRARLSALNAAVLVTLLRASAHMSPRDLLKSAQREGQALPQSDPRSVVLKWVLGVTRKLEENVLRSDDDAWGEFVRVISDVSDTSARKSESDFGALRLRLELGESSSEWDWLWAHTLMGALGAQTLATRGSEKSMYGKFFEKLVMGSVLEILGFRYDSHRRGNSMTYWLSEQKEKREADATAIIGPSEGCCFDIGFIGPGNSEITLDKVSRFRRFEEIRGRRIEMATVIIVDRVATGSGIVAHAEEIDGSIVQMSASMWAKDLDGVIGNRWPRYQNRFPVEMGMAEITRVVEKEMGAVDIRALVGAARAKQGRSLFSRDPAPRRNRFPVQGKMT